LTLATNDDDDDGSDEEFPKAVINRLVGLKQIQVIDNRTVIFALM
jgi:hypothetical protein